MSNRFAHCKSFIDLQKVLGDSIEFTSLTPEETERLVIVFCANASDKEANTLELPLTQAGFNYICTIVQETVVNIASQEMARKEGFNMMNTIKNMRTDETVKRAVDRASETISEAMADVKVRAGMDVEEFKLKADDSITTIKDATCGVLGFLDDLTGATVLKNSLYNVLYQNINDKSSKRGFFDGAAECRRIVNDYIDGILAYDPDEDEFKQVVALRYLIGEDEDGNPIQGHRSIFTAFANGIVWICKKVARKFKKWFGTDAESNIFGTVGASIASIFGMVAGIITAVIKVAVNVITFVGSYIVSAVIHAISFIWDKLKGFGGFMKQKFGKDDEVEDDFDDEELEYEA